MAEVQNLPFPDMERQIFNMRPERAIMDVSWPTALIYSCPRILAHRAF